MNEIMQQGYEARKDGWNVEDCAYEVASPKWDEWVKGWLRRDFEEIPKESFMKEQFTPTWQATITLVLYPGKAKEYHDALELISDLMGESADVLDWAYVEKKSPHTIVVPTDYHEGDFMKE